MVSNLKELNYQLAKSTSDLSLSRKLRTEYIQSLKNKFEPIADLHYWDSGKLIQKSIDELFDLGAFNKKIYLELKARDWESRWKNGVLLSVLGGSLNIFAKEVTQKVHVFPSSFRLSEVGFRCGLVYHELTHVRDNYYGIPIPSGGLIDNGVHKEVTINIIKPVKEIRAYLNELDGLINEDCNQISDVNSTVRSFFMYLESLKFHNYPDGNLERRIKHDFLEMGKSKFSDLKKNFSKQTLDYMREHDLNLSDF